MADHKSRAPEYLKLPRTVQIEYETLKTAFLESAYAWLNRDDRFALDPGDPSGPLYDKARADLAALTAFRKQWKLL